VHNSFFLLLLVSESLPPLLLASCFLCSGMGSSRGRSPLRVSPLWCTLPAAAVLQGSPCPGTGRMWPQSLGGVLAPAWVTHGCSPSELYLFQHGVSPPKSASSVMSPTIFLSTSPVLCLLSLTTTTLSYKPLSRGTMCSSDCLIFWHVVGVSANPPQ